MPPKCKHLSTIKFKETDKDFCEDCVKTGDTWVHLRMCLQCAHVGCCDNSKNKHATKHYKGTTHPLIRSVEPGEAWIWCYPEEMEAGEITS